MLLEGTYRDREKLEIQSQRELVKKKQSQRDRYRERDDQCPHLKLPRISQQYFVYSRQISGTLIVHVLLTLIKVDFHHNLKDLFSHGDFPCGDGAAYPSVKGTKSHAHI